MTNTDDDLDDLDLSRCGSCGKEMGPKVKAVRVDLGETDNKGLFAKGRTWGYFHRECFWKSVDSPDIAMQKIKRLAKATTNKKT